MKTYATVWSLAALSLSFLSMPLSADEKSADQKTNSAVTHHFRASAIEGMAVRNGAGEDLGKVRDLVIDLESGTVAYAALDFGGFLGFGDKLFAVPWDAFKIGTTDKVEHLVLATTKEKLTNAPGFDKSHWPVASDPEWSKVDTFYGPLRTTQPSTKAGIKTATINKANLSNDSPDSDHMLATCVAIGNQEEIAIAKLAEEKAQHKDVKEFAAMLVKDHQAFNQKLRKFAPEATQDGYLMEKGAPTADGSRRTSSTLQKAPVSERSSIQQTAATNEKSDSQPLDLVQLHRELAEECIQAAKIGMTKKNGAEFDECFIGYQIAMHAGMKNKLTVFERHVSGELKQVLAAGIETVETHMKKAEQIMKKLSDADSSTAKEGRSDGSK